MIVRAMRDVAAWRLGLLGAIAGMAAAGLVVLVAVLVYLVNAADSGEQQRDRLEQLANLLVECTTAPADRIPPEAADPRDCYVRQQQRSDDFLGQPRGPVNAVTTAAAACGAAHPGDVPATRRCVVAALAVPPE